MTVQTTASFVSVRTYAAIATGVVHQMKSRTYVKKIMPHQNQGLVMPRGFDVYIKGVADVAVDLNQINCIFSQHGAEDIGIARICVGCYVKVTAY